MPEEPVKSKDVPSTKRIWKNVICIGVAFMFTFSGAQAMFNIQSSLYREAGLGLASFAVINGMLVFTCLFLASVAIRTIGLRTSLWLGMAGYCVYLACNFYPNWGTIMFGSVAVAVSSAPIWSAQSSYIAEAGKEYAKLTGVDIKSVLNRFFGVFFMFQMTSQIWSNMLSAWVLYRPPLNQSIPLSYCGIESCSDLSANETVFSWEKPPIDQIYLLCGIALGFGMLAPITILLFLDPRPIQREPGDVKRALTATFRQIRHPVQLLLVPISMHSGIEGSFLISIYNKVYITCALDIDKVGISMIVFGIVSPLASITFGRLVARTGYLFLFVVAALLNFILLAILFLPFETYGAIAMYAWAGLWGAADAVWQSQLNAYYANIFEDEKEAAFAHLKLWKSLGGFIINLVGIFFCVDHIVYGQLAFLAFSMLLLFVVERRYPVGKNIYVING